MSKPSFMNIVTNKKIAPRFSTVEERSAFLEKHGTLQMERTQYHLYIKKKTQYGFNVDWDNCPTPKGQFPRFLRNTFGLTVDKTSYLTKIVPDFDMSFKEVLEWVYYDSGDVDIWGTAIANQVTVDVAMGIPIIDRQDIVNAIKYIEEANPFAADRSEPLSVDNLHYSSFLPAFNYLAGSKLTHAELKAILDEST